MRREEEKTTLKKICAPKGNPIGVLKTPTHKRFSEQNLYEREKKERIHAVYTYLCEHIVPDELGDPVCLYDLEFPGDCRADNCPFLKGVLSNEDGC